MTTAPVADSITTDLQLYVFIEEVRRFPNIVAPSIIVNEKLRFKIPCFTTEKMVDSLLLKSYTDGSRYAYLKYNESNLEKVDTCRFRTIVL